MDKPSRYFAIQAVKRWQQGLWIPKKAWSLLGIYRPLIAELYSCFIAAKTLTPEPSALIAEDLWAMIRVWPRFNHLADAVDAYDERASHASAL